MREFSEQQLRIWHDATGKGPADHPGLRNLTQEETEAVDTSHLLSLVGGQNTANPNATQDIADVRQAS